MSASFPWKLGGELFKFPRLSQPAAQPGPSHKTQPIPKLETRPTPSLETRPFSSSSIFKDLNISSAFREARLKEVRSAPSPPTLPNPPTLPSPPTLASQPNPPSQPNSSSQPCQPKPSPPSLPCLPTRRLGPLPALGAGGGLATTLFTLLQPSHTSNPPEKQAESKPAPPSPVQETANDKNDGLPESDDLVDERPSQEAIEDSFETDLNPKRDEILPTITPEPCNSESPGDELTRYSLTPNEVCHVRNYTGLPKVEEARVDNHSINIELSGGGTKTYTLHDLKTLFKHHNVSANLQRPGNRRKDMPAHAKKTDGLQWADVGANSCAKWEGVRLRDVLADAGVRPDDPGNDAQHVHFSGLEEAYGASIPITSALDPRGDVLLAFKVDGQPLLRDHGSPVRIIVPGHVTAYCVNWFNKIVVSDKESPTQRQRRDYKCLGPNETVQDWDDYRSIPARPITSVITRTRLKPLQSGKDKASGGSKGDRQILGLEGFAYPGGGHEIQRVDVSLKNQQQGGRAKTKTKPSTKIKLTFAVRATDDAYNTQPEHYASTYTLRGNLATPRHYVGFEYASSSAQKNGVIGESKQLASLEANIRLAGSAPPWSLGRSLSSK